MRGILNYLLYLIGVAGVSASCTKDACYNNVAAQVQGGPNMASRRADCSSILRTVVDDTATVTVVKVVTGTPLTTTTVTTRTSTNVVTSTLTTRFSERRHDEDVSVDSDPELEARAQIVIKGNKPAYATNCKSNQLYAVACLCFGVKAGQQRTVTQYKTVFTTTTATSTTTSSTTTVLTATTTVLCSTDFDNDKKNCGECGNTCAMGQVCRRSTCVFDQCRVIFAGGCGTYGDCPSSAADDGCDGGQCVDTAVGLRCIAGGACQNDGSEGCSSFDSRCSTGSTCVFSPCCGGFICLEVRDCPNLNKRALEDLQGLSQMSRRRTGYRVL